MKNVHLSNSTIFPLGEKVEQHFIGDAFLQMVFTDPAPLNTAIGNVTFAPGARNNWHAHHAGQVLLVTGGEGWYQEEGKPSPTAPNRRRGQHSAERKALAWGHQRELVCTLGTYAGANRLVRTRNRGRIQ